MKARSPLSVFNQFSYVFVTLFVFAICLGLLRVLNVSPRVIGLAAVTLVVMFGAGFFVLRPGSADVTALEDAEALLQNGKPTFLEFFSNY